MASESADYRTCAMGPRAGRDLYLRDEHEWIAALIAALAFDPPDPVARGKRHS
jgi:hypothetical protein